MSARHENAGHCDGAYEVEWIEGRGILAVFSFKPQSQPLVVKVALSPVSEANAIANMDAEVPGFDFDAVRSAAIGLKAIGALLYCGDARVRPTLLAPAAPATSGPLVVLRKRTSPTDVSDAQEHRDEAHHFA